MPKKKDAEVIEAEVTATDGAAGGQTTALVQQRRFEVTNTPLATMDRLKEVTAQKLVMREFIQNVLEQGLDKDYAKIPNAGDKDVLLQPGAQKICMLMNVVPTYCGHSEMVEVAGVQHLIHHAKCQLKVFGTDHVAAEGEALCTSLEVKYRYRGGERKCPNCGKATIIKGKAQYGGGWLCYEKKGGCKSKFPDGDKSIEGQEIGKVENPDPADQFNTVIKMGNKRALVAATLNLQGGWSTHFTQDMEEQHAGYSPHSDERNEWGEPPPQDDIPFGSIGKAPVDDSGWVQEQQKNELRFFIDDLAGTFLNEDEAAKVKRMLINAWVKLVEKEGLKKDLSDCTVNRFNGLFSLYKKSANDNFSPKAR